MKRTKAWSSIEGSLRQTPKLQAPPGLADEVIKNVEERAKDFGDGTSAFWLFKAKPLLAAAAVLIISLALLWIYQRPAPEKDLALRQRVKEVDFKIDLPGARSVAVVGDFNRWNREKHVLGRQEDGSWSITLSLKPGCYQYLFLVDKKEWMGDPGNSVRVPDGFGGFNSGMEI